MKCRKIANILSNLAGILTAGLFWKMRKVFLPSCVFPFPVSASFLLLSPCAPSFSYVVLLVFPTSYVSPPCASYFSYRFLLVSHKFRSSYLARDPSSTHLLDQCLRDVFSSMRGEQSNFIITSELFKVNYFVFVRIER